MIKRTFKQTWNFLGEIVEWMFKTGSEIVRCFCNRFEKFGTNWFNHAVIIASAIKFSFQINFWRQMTGDYLLVEATTKISSFMNHNHFFKYYINHI